MPLKKDAVINVNKFVSNPEPQRVDNSEIEDIHLACLRFLNAVSLVTYCIGVTPEVEKLALDVLEEDFSLINSKYQELIKDARLFGLAVVINIKK